MNPYYQTSNSTIYNGDALAVLSQLPDESVQMCVTSPPYFGLRNYGVDGQMGLEETPEAYVDAMVLVFREVNRVLKNDATLWLNIGDSSSSSQSNNGGYSDKSTLQGFTKPDTKRRMQCADGMRRKLTSGCKPKDLIGIPWMLAFALRSDGWYLRSDIIWAKPNPMPESVLDRPTRSHEYLFLLSKSERYFYDHEAIKEPAAESSIARWAQDIDSQNGSARCNGGSKSNGNMKAVGGDKQRGHSRRHAGFNDRWDEKEKARMSPYSQQMQTGGKETQALGISPEYRNKRDVWTISTKSFSEAHFAVFPPELVQPCIRAGSRLNDVVLDPFFGSGTTGVVAISEGRKCIGIELSEEYCRMAARRCRDAQPSMFAEVLE